MRRRILALECIVAECDETYSPSSVGISEEGGEAMRFVQEDFPVFATVSHVLFWFRQSVVALWLTLLKFWL